MVIASTLITCIHCTHLGKWQSFHSAKFHLCWFVSTVVSPLPRARRVWPCFVFYETPHEHRRRCSTLWQPLVASPDCIQILSPLACPSGLGPMPWDLCPGTSHGLMGSCKWQRFLLGLLNLRSVVCSIGSGIACAGLASPWHQRWKASLMQLAVSPVV